MEILNSFKTLKEFLQETNQPINAYLSMNAKGERVYNFKIEPLNTNISIKVALEEDKNMYGFDFYVQVEDNNRSDSFQITRQELDVLTPLLFKFEINCWIYSPEASLLEEMFIDYANALELTAEYDLDN